MPRGKSNAAPTEDTNGKTMSKREAMRQALAHIGLKAKPEKYREFIKDNFGLELSNNMVSTYKSGLKKRRGRKKNAGPAEGGSSSSMVRKSSPPARAEDISVEDIRSVKELADKIGAEKVRLLAEVLAE